MTEFDRFVPLPQVAEALAVSKRTLERWIADGRLPAPGRSGGKRVDPVSAVTAMVE